MQQVQVSMLFTVADEPSLRQAAHAEAVDVVGPEQAEGYLNGDLDIQACVHMLTVPNGVAGVELEWSQSAEELDHGYQASIAAQAIADFKGRVFAAKTFDVPENWIVMNAPRPLLGHQTFSNGPFLSGRYYAAIDPCDSMASIYIEKNRQLDARVVIQASKAVQVEMALVELKYAEQYRSDFSGEELYRAVSPERRLCDRSVTDLLARKGKALALVA